MFSINYGIAGFPITTKMESLENLKGATTDSVPYPKDDQDYTESSLDDRTKYIPFLHRCISVIFVGIDTFGEQTSYAIHIQPWVFQNSDLACDVFEKISLSHLYTIKKRSEKVYAIISGGCRKSYVPALKRSIDFRRLNQGAYRCIEKYCEIFFEESFMGATIHPPKPSQNRHMYTMVVYDGQKNVKIVDFDIRNLKSPPA